jgi:hypothetical protein
MAIKKKRTAKQIAATKKLVAFNKKRRANPIKRKKNPGRPTLSTAQKKAKAKSRVAINKKSQVTKRRPTTRLKKRRAKNIAIGTFPNPIFYVAFVRVGESKYYYSGFDVVKKKATFDDDIEKALWYRTKKQAVDEVTFLGKKSGALHPRKHTVEAERYRPK